MILSLGHHACMQTHLISKDSYGAGGGHLVSAEPDRGQAGGHPQDEDLGQGTRTLSEHGHPEQVRSGTGHFDPRPRAVERVGQQRRDPQPLLIQQPGDREDEGDVGEHEDHGEPVHSEGLHAVELHDDVVDDAVLDPLIRVAQGVGAEQEHDEPALLVEARGSSGAALTVWDAVALNLLPGISTFGFQTWASLLRVLRAAVQGSSRVITHVSLSEKNNQRTLKD